MADAPLTLIADALANALNTQTFDPACDAVREWAADTPLKDLNRIQLLVIGVDWTMERASRDLGAWHEHYLVNIGVRQRHHGESGKLAPKEILDPLVDLSWAITKYVRQTRLSFTLGGSAAEATPDTVKSIASIAREDLSKLRVFSSVFEINYRLKL